MAKTETKKIIIGLTGTIGSGKSFVADALAELGAEIIDTDLIAREVVAPGARALEEISGRWGARALNDDGTLNREAVAAIVFNDESERQWLNNLLHPIIGSETSTRAREAAGPVVVLAVPLLFESGMNNMVDQSWLIVADEAQLIDRIKARDGCSAEDARARIKTQMSQDEKIKLSDVVIDNSGTMEQTRGILKEEYKRIEEL